MEESKKCFAGIVVSEGLALAKTYHYRTTDFEIRCQEAPKEAASEQLTLFRDASEKAKKQLLYAADTCKAEEANLFLAYVQLLEDEEICSKISKKIEEEFLYAEMAVEQVYMAYANLFSSAEDDLLAARAADLQDVKNRLLCCLLGREYMDISHLPDDVIVVCDELLPSAVATMDKIHVKGVIAQRGGYNSHSAIMLRNYAVPAVFGISDAMGCIPNGTDVMLNATEGYYILSPDACVTDRFHFLQNERKIRMEEMEKYRLQPCRRKDGTKVEIGLNIENADFENTEGLFDFVGLVRTEFLYMGSNKLPSEEKQFEIYREIVERAASRPVTFRTLDVGGDKILPYFKSQQMTETMETVRGVRFCFSQEELFFAQLRAILRASAYGSAQVMFPMVESIEDISVAREYLEKAKEQLRKRGDSFDDRMKVGIMIEVPAIAMQADKVAELVDFASIGTNDLSQALGKSDRQHMTVEEYYQSNNENMRKLLQGIFEAFDKAGKPVSVCGEMAGNPQMAEMLVDLGAKSLSMNVTGIATVKAHLLR